MNIWGLEKANTICSLKKILIHTGLRLSGILSKTGKFIDSGTSLRESRSYDKLQLPVQFQLVGYLSVAARTKSISLISCVQFGHSVLGAPVSRTLFGFSSGPEWVACSWNCCIFSLVKHGWINTAPLRRIFGCLRLQKKEAKMLFHVI